MGSNVHYSALVFVQWISSPQIVQPPPCLPLCHAGIHCVCELCVAIGFSSMSVFFAAMAFVVFMAFMAFMAFEACLVVFALFVAFMAFIAFEAFEAFVVFTFEAFMAFVVFIAFEAFMAVVDFPAGVLQTA